MLEYTHKHKNTAVVFLFVFNLSDGHDNISMRQTFTINLSVTICLSALHANLFNVYDNRNRFVDFSLILMGAFNAHYLLGAARKKLTFVALTETSNYSQQIQREE